MKQKLTSAELCRKYRNEDVHTEYVTALAKDVFERTRAHLGLSSDDGRLLEAAAVLHDIGLLDDPEQHAGRSAAIIRKEGLAGFTNEERTIIAAAVSVHSGKCRCGNMAVPVDADGRRALRIGALLRLADALDHAHIQTATLSSVKLERSTFLVSVRSPGYPNAVREANSRTDLWNRMFPLHIRFAPDGAAFKSHDFSAVVHETGLARETLRQLMLIQYRIVADARSAILKRPQPKDLHDLRVAIRRLRAALRLHCSLRTDRVATRLNNLLARFCKSLGPTRDAQTWEIFLDLSATRAPASRAGAWRQYMKLVHCRATRLTTALARTMRSNEWRAISVAMKRFLRCSMVRSSSADDDVPFTALAGRELRRLHARLYALKIDASKLTPQELHSLRRKVRRARYWAEFLAPAVPKSAVPTLAEILRRCAGALGDAHDMDVYIARLQRDRIRGAARLKEDLLERRNRAVRKFQNTWDRRFHGELPP